MRKRYFFAFWLIALSFLSSATLLPDGDYDQDGWTTAEEIEAGTDPLNPADYPRPEWNVEFLYFGTNANWRNESLIVLAYSERLFPYKGQFQERSFLWYGGTPDAVWMSGDGARHTERLNFDSAGRATLSKGVAKPHTINIAGHTHDACDVPIDATTGRLWCYYSGVPTIDYGSGQISGGLAGVALPISYDWQYPDKHLVGGVHNFFGFMDLNKNGKFDAGEPCGLPEQHRTIVDATNAVAIVIPLTDSLVGFPRISWEQADFPGNEVDYTVDFSTSSGVSSSFNVCKPRTFLHEGDFYKAGGYGLGLWEAVSLVFEYTVKVGNDVVVDSGLVYVDLGKTAVTSRRTMEVIYPNGDVVTNPVEFRWKMDYRMQGARIKIDNLDESKTYYDEIIPFPTRIGKITDEVYFYRATPQLVDATKFFTLPPGNYEYTIKEQVRTTSDLITKQTIEGTFTVE